MLHHSATPFPHLAKSGSEVPGEPALAASQLNPTATGLRVSWDDSVLAGAFEEPERENPKCKAQPRRTAEKLIQPPENPSSTVGEGQQPTSISTLNDVSSVLERSTSMKKKEASAEEGVVLEIDRCSQVATAPDIVILFHTLVQDGAVPDGFELQFSPLAPVAPEAKVN